MCNKRLRWLVEIEDILKLDLKCGFIFFFSADQNLPGSKVTNQQVAATVAESNDLLLMSTPPTTKTKVKHPAVRALENQLLHGDSSGVTAPVDILTHTPDGLQDVSILNRLYMHSNSFHYSFPNSKLQP